MSAYETLCFEQHRILVMAAAIGGWVTSVPPSTACHRLNEGQQQREWDLPYQHTWQREGISLHLHAHRRLLLLMSASMQMGSCWSGQAGSQRCP